MYLRLIAMFAIGSLTASAQIQVANKAIIVTQTNVRAIDKDTDTVEQVFLAKTEDGYWYNGLMMKKHLIALRISKTIRRKPPSIAGLSNRRSTFL
jgi:hypothetical protein